MGFKQVTIKAGNTFSDPVTLTDQLFTISVRGLSETGSQVVLQRKLTTEAASEWRTTDRYTADVDTNGQSIESWDYRIGCPDGGYVGGTIVALIGY